MAAVRLTSLLLLLVAGSGCNTAKLIPAPDASPDCPAPILESTCRPAAAPGAPACGPDLQSAGAFDRDVVLDGGSYPPGCIVEVNDPVPDEDNQCSQLGTCRCEPSDAGPPGWSCAP